MADRKPYPSEQQERFIIRFPDGMRDKISALAKANGRSMNAEVISMVEASLSHGGKPLLVVHENTAEADIIWELRDQMQHLQAEVRELRASLMKAIDGEVDPETVGVPDFTNNGMAIRETRHMVAELLERVRTLTKSPTTGDRSKKA